MSAAPTSRPLTEESDWDLVVAVKNGEDRAFEILVNRYKARILSLAFRITRNHEDAQDVTQQSFQNAFVHLQKFQGKSSFPTWLTRIAINLNSEVGIAFTESFAGICVQVAGNGGNFGEVEVP
jgi:RNA polymerase sigma-70 factor (ECF subfamily)